MISIYFIEGKNLIVFCPITAPDNIIRINPIIIENIILSQSGAGPLPTGEGV